MLTIVSVAYPFAMVDADPVGGAEQILSQLDRALVANGHRSIVIAQDGSTPAGRLVPLPRREGEIDEAARAQVRRAIDDAIGEVIEREHVDLIHFHGIDFHEHLVSPGPPILATLHLPLDWYPDRALHPARPNTWLNPVSRNQVDRVPANANFNLLPPIENGVDVDRFPVGVRKENFAVAIGRICPEKGLHLALDAAAAADWPLLLAGEVFPYPGHRAYFAEQIVPRLDRHRRWIGHVSGAKKCHILAAARCVLVPSLVPETSSLVAREALAAGTPVIAFATGALASVIEHGRTGFLVRDPDEMTRAIADCAALDGERCRQAARERFSSREMIRRYFSVYDHLAA